MLSGYGRLHRILDGEVEPDVDFSVGEYGVGPVLEIRDTGPACPVTPTPPFSSGGEG